MAADFQKPALPDQYAAVLQEIRDMFAALGIWMDGTLPANVPAGAKRWSSANKRFEQFDGTAWNPLVNQYAIDVLSVGGYQAGHATGQVPVSDGTVNTDLNADLLDGQHGAYYATQTGLAAVQAVANAALPQVGGELTGQTSISGAAATNRQFGWQTVGVARWFAGADSSAESGSNAGSNWFLSRFDDNGGYIDTPLAVSRVTGVVSMPKGILTTGTITSQSAAPIFVLDENDQAGAAGLWRIVADGANFSVRRNTAAARDFSAEATDLAISAGGVLELDARPTFGGATPWDSANFSPANYQPVGNYVFSRDGHHISFLWDGSSIDLNVDEAVNYAIWCTNNLPNPAHADGSFSWTSVWTGNATSINLSSSFGIGIYLIQIGSGGGQMVMIVNGLGASVIPASTLVAAADIYSGSSGSAALQIWKLTKG